MGHNTASLKVMSARAVHVAVGTLAEDFSRETACGTDISYAPVGVLQDRLKAGETADVLILSVGPLAQMEKAGALVPGTRTDLGATAIGISVREGATAPDISTPEAFERLLMSARAIALSDPAVGGTAGTYLRDLFQRLGLADKLAAKSLPQKSGALVAESVAKGESEIGMTFISEMLPVKGVRIVGPIPAPHGSATAYAAAVMAGSAQADLAKAFIATLTRPARRDVWQAAGFDLHQFNS